MKICIKGIGVLGGFGCGIAQLESALVAGRSPEETVVMQTVEGRYDVPALIARTDRLSDYIEKSVLRRVDHFIRLALLGSYLALDDAGMLETRPGRMGIIVATGYGSTCNMMDIQQALDNNAPAISPTRFSNSVHNAAATHISILLGEMSPNLSVGDYDMSIAAAFLSACSWLREKRVEAVLVGGVDEYCKALGYNWYHRYRAADPEKGHARDPGHAVIGEGACFFVLKLQQEASPYGCIEAVRIGNYRQEERVAAAEDAVCFLNVDAYSEYDDLYGVYLPANTTAAAYSQVYGVLPVGPGFDIAIAALSRKSDRIHACAGDVRSRSVRLNFTRRAQPLGRRSICCLKLGAGGAYGAVRLGGASAKPAAATARNRRVGSREEV